MSSSVDQIARKRPSDAASNPSSTATFIPTSCRLTVELSCGPTTPARRHWIVRPGWRSRPRSGRPVSCSEWLGGESGSTALDAEVRRSKWVGAVWAEAPTLSPAPDGPRHAADGHPHKRPVQERVAKQGKPPRSQRHDAAVDACRAAHGSWSNPDRSR